MKFLSSAHSTNTFIFNKLMLNDSYREQPVALPTRTSHVNYPCYPSSEHGNFYPTSWMTRTVETHHLPPDPCSTAMTTFFSKLVPSSPQKCKQVYCRVDIHNNLLHVSANHVATSDHVRNGLNVIAVKEQK